MTMSKSFPLPTWLGAAALSLALAGCGSSSDNGSSSGQARTESTTPGTITLKDSSTPMQTRTSPVNGDGTFALQTSGLTPPYLLRAEWTDGSGARQLYGISEDHENVDVNGITDAAYASACEGDTEDHVFEDSNSEGKHGAAAKVRALLAKLMTSPLAPLFARYGITDPRVDRDAVRLLLADVIVTRHEGMVTVTNRATGKVIFVGRLSDLNSGTFTAANMPPGPSSGSTCTAFTYSAFADCQPDGTQTRTVLTSTPTGCTGGGPILSQTCTYVPPTNACTSFTYSAYGACQPDNSQTRTVLTSSPAGCTGGTPVLSQACTYVPPVNTCTSFTYSAYGACQANNTQTRTVLTSSPAGCTGGAPVLSQACTYVPPIDGAALYTQYCSGCHGNSKKGKSATAIQNAINGNVGGMGSLSALTPAQVAAISAAP
jgi:hypothetical protein